MNVFGRSEELWETLFVFHFLGYQGFGEKLQDLVAKRTADGVNFDVPLAYEAKRKKYQLLGRFLRPNECKELLYSWNEPDGETAFMCYTPNHGIATIRNGEIDWWTLICFQCLNAGIYGPRASSKDRLLPAGSALEEKLLGLLPERPFPIWGDFQP